MNLMGKEVVTNKNAIAASIAVKTYNRGAELIDFVRTRGSGQ